MRGRLVKIKIPLSLSHHPAQKLLTEMNWERTPIEGDAFSCGAFNLIGQARLNEMWWGKATHKVRVRSGATIGEKRK